MQAKVIIAVDAVGVSALAGPIVASAVLFLAKEQEPLFEYTDARGRTCRSRILSKGRRISEHVRVPLAAHLRRTLLSWSLVSREASYAVKNNAKQTKQEVMGWAVARCVERFIHSQPVLAKGIRSEEIHICLPDKQRLPTDLVSLTPQIAYAQTWHTGAAYILAYMRHAEIMRELDRSFPLYHLAENLGTHSLEHMAAIKRHGLSPIHRKDHPFLRGFR